MYYLTWKIFPESKFCSIQYSETLPDSVLSSERVIGMCSWAEERQSLDGRTGLGVGSNESRKFSFDGRGCVDRIDRVEAFREEDGEGRRDVPRIPDVVLPLLVRLLQPDVLFEKLHGVRILWSSFKIITHKFSQILMYICYNKNYLIYRVLI